MAKDRTTDPTGKPEIKVIVNIRPGPASPYQKTIWGKLYQKLISEVQGDLHAEGETKNDRSNG